MRQVAEISPFPPVIHAVSVRIEEGDARKAGKEHILVAIEVALDQV